MDAAALELADRVRALLADGPACEEKRMFGTRAFLLDGKILVGARKGGTLLVRVDDEQGAALLTRPGVQIAVMGPRSMSPRWLDVDAEVIADDDALLRWLDVARECGASAERGADG